MIKYILVISGKGKEFFIMSEVKTVAAIHDLSGYGRCALSVILPVISAMGIQAVPVPTAVLSTHTGGFENIVLRDLTRHINECYNHYRTLGVKFDAIYSGFLSSSAQVDCCLKYLHGYKNALKVVDPVLGDNGVPYQTCTPELMKRMKELVAYADVITPNLTECCMLLHENCPDSMSAEQAKKWLTRLTASSDYAVIKGVPLAENGKITLSNICYDKQSCEFWRIDWDHIPVHYPGTGDIFCSVLTGALLGGENLPTAVSRATSFTEDTVKATYMDKTEERNGVAFEKVLDKLILKQQNIEYKKL